MVADCDFTLDGNMIPGITNATPEQRDTLRTTFARFSYYCDFLRDSHKELCKSTFKDTMADARVCLVNDTMSAEDQPFNEPHKKSGLNFDSSFASAQAMSCQQPWGPRPGLVSDMLSPVGTFAISYLGPVYGTPLLDLAYAFADDYQSFASAWLNCPARIDHIDLPAVKTRAAALRNSQLVNSPGDAVIELATRANKVLENVIRSIYRAISHRAVPAQLATINRPFVSPNITEIAKSAASQYLDCTPAVGSKVQSILPTTSSIPDVTPNFNDDRSATWFRNAQYAFESIKMPTAAVLRGDTLSELKWHKYKSDVLHARNNVPLLSERQVIQHLTTTFSRTDHHNAVAQQAALEPECTVKSWLDVISDFYFTGGQFRVNVENGWRSYASDQCPDFNEFIHHIKTYYSLIYLDYAHLRGTMHKIDFAWVLANMLNDLCNNPSVSKLAKTLSGFMPHSRLIEWMGGELRDAMKGLINNPDMVATDFITWAIRQLQGIRETANISSAARPSHEQDSRIDYAMLGAPKRNRPQRNNDNRPPQQAAAAAAAVNTQTPLPPPPGNQRNDVQRGKRPNGLHQKVPHLKAMANTPDAAAFTAWTRDLSTAPDITPAVKDYVIKELAGGPTALHVVLGRAVKPLPNGLKPTFHSVVQQAIKMHYLFGYKQCILCPNTRSNPDHPPAQCTVASCPTLASLLSPGDHATISADADNRVRGTYPHAPGHTNTTDTRQESKRSRYDPDRRGSQSQQPKRTRAHQSTEREFTR